MRTSPSGDFLLQLTRFPVLFPVNCYLVREDDGFTLIDAAIPGSAPAILAAAGGAGGALCGCSPASTYSAATQPVPRFRASTASQARPSSLLASSVMSSVVPNGNCARTP